MKCLFLSVKYLADILGSARTTEESYKSNSNWEEGYISQLKAKCPISIGHHRGSRNYF
jgi:hypothetical protein